MEAWINFWLFLATVVIGVLLEIVISQIHYFSTKKHYKKYKFSLGRILFLLLFPALGFILMLTRMSYPLFHVFIFTAILGTALEWLVGFSFHMVVGHRLWMYYRYPISTYTSLLSIPLWGLAGVLFYLLIQALSLS